MGVGVGVWGGTEMCPLCIIHERFTYGTSKLPASPSAAAGSPADPVQSSSRSNKPSMFTFSQ